MLRMRGFRLLAVMTITLALASTGFAWPGNGGGGGGKGGGGTEPPPPSVPVRYLIKSFAMPADHDGGTGAHAYQMTSSGVVVGDYLDTNGYRQAFVYDPAIDPDSAVNLADQGIVGLPEGSRILTALDVNDLGFVVGVLEALDTPGFYNGFILDLGSAPPALTAIPYGSKHTYSRRMNDSMDIIGGYQNDDGSWGAYLYNPLIDDQPNDLGLSVAIYGLTINNPGEGQALKVAGHLGDGTNFRLTVGGALETFAGDLPQPSYIQDINPAGDLCGSYAYRKKGQNHYMAFRYSTQPELFSDFDRASAINDHGDLTLNLASDLRPYLHHEGTGAIPLDDIVDGGPDELARWFAAGFIDLPDMTERGAMNPDTPDFPGVSGMLDNMPQAAPRGYVLFPVPAP